MKLEISTIIRRAWLPFVLLLGTLYIVLRFSEIESIAASLRTVKAAYILAALVSQAIMLGMQAGLLGISLKQLDFQFNLKTVLALSLGMEFIQISVPSAGVSGIGYIAIKTADSSDGRARASVAGILYYLNGYLATAAVVISAGLANRLSSVIYGFLMIGLIGGFAFLLVRKYQRFFGRYMPSAVRKKLIAARTSGWQALQTLMERYREQPGLALLGFLCAIGVDAANIAVLWLIAGGLGVGVSFHHILVIYCVGMILAIFSVTPSGLGFVEPAMIVAFTRYHVSTDTAFAIVALYRAVNFWLPFILGMLTTAMNGGLRQIENQ